MHTRLALVSKMTGASRKITETVAEGRGWANGDNGVEKVENMESIARRGTRLFCQPEN